MKMNDFHCLEKKLFPRKQIKNRNLGFKPVCCLQESSNRIKEIKENKEDRIHSSVSRIKCISLTSKAWGIFITIKGFLGISQGYPGNRISI